MNKGILAVATVIIVAVIVGVGLQGTGDWLKEEFSDDITESIGNGCSSIGNAVLTGLFIGALLAAAFVAAMLYFMGGWGG
ncbi:hypothetical protein [Methanoculleus sp.]|uniref:hypothetical protein n=1 Tax=Methanoculleus sp. TaxID=90427 RepID=UPI002FC8924E